MANRENLRRRIVEILQQSQDNTCSAKDLIKYLGTNKKTVNVELYALKREKILDKLQDTPPIWKLVNQNIAKLSDVRVKKHQQNVTTAASGGRRGKNKYDKIQKSKCDVALHKKILSFLQGQVKPVQALHIAKSLGYRNSEINSSLYAMEKEGLVSKVSNKPVLWIRNSQCNSEESLLDDPGIVSFGILNRNQMDNTGPCVPSSSIHVDNTFEYQDKFRDSEMVLAESSQNLTAQKSLFETPGPVDEIRVSNFNLANEDLPQYLGDSDTSLNDPFMGTLSGSQMSEVGYDSSQSEPSLSTDLIMNVKKELVCSGYLDEENNSQQLTKTDGTGSTLSVEMSDAEERIELSPLTISESPSEGKESASDVMANTDVKELHVQEEGWTDGEEEIDTVLKALWKSPQRTAVSFIIACKTKMEKSAVEDVLEKCRKMKFVHFHENAWIMSKEGDKYIETKLTSSDTRERPYVHVQQIQGSPSNLKKEFKGPPPAPASLVSNPESSFFSPPSSTSTDQCNETDTCQNFQGSSVNQPPRNVQIFPNAVNTEKMSSAKPVPLMSLNTGAFSSNYSIPPASVKSSSQPVPLMSLNTGAFSSNSSMSSATVVQHPYKAQCSNSFSSLPVTSTFSSHTLQSSIQGNKLPNTFSDPSSDKINMPQMFGRGRGRGLMTMMQQSKARPVGMSNTGGSFKPPLPPVDLIRQQLKKTDISSSASYDGSKPPLISTTLASTGLKKLMSMTNTSITSKQESVSNVGGGTPHETLKMSIDSTRQPQSLPVMNRAIPHTISQSLPVMNRPIPQTMNLSQSLPGPHPFSLSSESFAALNKNPVSALMEYAQSRHKEARFEMISQSGPSHRPRFLLGVFIGDKKIVSVECSNKKDGRKEAADKALRVLIASGEYSMANTAASKPQVPLDKMTHFDKVAALVHKLFNELSASIIENFSGRKVVAGLVMKLSPEDIGTVISVGTGNRCITGPQLSLEGNTVNDSHAEIITRRGFIRFMYKQLMTYNPNSPHRLFEPSPSGKLKLKNNVTFHLYISTAPCGDGALFSPRDEASNNATLSNINDRSHKPTFSSTAQGLLRTKMEGGEGTIPIEDDFTVQTFDGIQRGERLRTMSCTDKLCRWNVVGMQGALLSHFLDPVYLDSLTLGLLYDHGHLARAMCCRLTKGNTDICGLLPHTYKLNHPWLGRVTVCDVPRETQKTKALSVNWCYGDEKAEVTDGTLGLCCTSIEKTLFSRCSKKNMYDSFKNLCQKFGKTDLMHFKTYNKAKMAAQDFVVAKKALLTKVKENGYGTWVSKPPEEEMFS